MGIFSPTAKIELNEQSLESNIATESNAEQITAAAEPVAEAAPEVEQIAAVAEQSAEGAVQKDEPVDGKDDNLTVGTTDSDVELPEGEFTMPVTEPEAQQSAVPTSTHNKFQMTLALLDKAAVQDRKAQGLFQSLDQFAMIEAFTAVATEHNLSAPVVAAFRATPGFTAAVESFPDTALFNMVGEHKSSDRNVVGLESLQAAITGTSDLIRDRAGDVITASDNVLTSLADTVTNLKVQIAQSTAALAASEITDEVLGSLPVYSMAAESFTALLTKLEDNLKNIDVFNADELRAHPEQLVNEITALESLVADIGDSVGLTITQYGLQDADKSDTYAMTAGTFADKNLTKVDLEMLLTKAEGIADALEALSQNQADITGAMLTASADMPLTAHSDDVTYGYVDHVSLMTSHAKFTTKLAVESVQAVSTLLTTVDAALDIETGFEA